MMHLTLFFIYAILKKVKLILFTVGIGWGLTDESKTGSRRHICL